jgi:hypothetical protein
MFCKPLEEQYRGNVVTAYKAGACLYPRGIRRLSAEDHCASAAAQVGAEVIKLMKARNTIRQIIMQLTEQ